YVSHVSDMQIQCLSFCPHLSQRFPFPNCSLSSLQIPNAHRNFFSQPSVNAVVTDENKITIGPPKSDEKDNYVVYYGPISETIRRVKLLSLSTCCLSVSLGPAVTFLTSPAMNVILKGAVASSVIFISASTTAALHWFASPYVHKLKWQPGSDSFEVEMLSWLATYLPRTIQFSDIKPADTNRPYVTFEAKGEYYFIDADRFPNKALLAKLIPKQPARTLKNL
ncbi:hypothetical protein KI387_012554, partial [Taxus chinensis]